MTDQVNNPSHYQFGQMEAWDIIGLALIGTRDPETAYHVASALKYLLRAARKGGDTDIAKAAAHLKRETARHGVRMPPSPDYDPASVAFRHGGDIGWLGDAAVSEVCQSCGKDDAPQTAAELAAADGVSEYGNPITPGCATPPWRLP